MSEIATETTTEQENHQSVMDEILGRSTHKSQEQQEISTPLAEKTTTIAEEPVIPIIEPNTPQPETPSTNIYQNLAEISNGLVDSEDAFKGIVDKATKYDGLESQFNTLTEQYETSKTANPFANEYLAKLNSLYQDGADAKKIETFQRINTLGDVAQLSSVDALKWELREKHGLSDEDADVMLATKYKSDDTLYSDDEVRAANIQMKIDSENAKSYLGGLQASFEPKAQEQQVKPLTKEEITLQEQAFEKQITPVVKAIEQELPSFFEKINVNGLQGDKAELITLPITAEMQTTISEQVKKFATINQIDTSDSENIKGLKEYAQNLAVLSNWRAWMIDASSKKEEALRTEFHNPDSISRGASNPSTPTISTEQEIASRIAKGKY